MYLWEYYYEKSFYNTFTTNYKWLIVIDSNLTYHLDYFLSQQSVT